MSFLIGVDGGGTGCRAVLCDGAGNRLGLGESGPANIMTNFKDARSNILEACANACGDAGLEENALSGASVFLGLAGANIGDCAARMEAELPFGQCRIETDAIIALEGAIGPQDGAVAIIGTGSVFIYRVGGAIRIAGGWGFTVGDLGSGARLGRTLLQETLLSYDGIHSGSGLTARILRQFENDPQTIVEYAHTAKPGEFGVFAPLIFEFAEHNDPIARKIVHKAVLDIEEALEIILSKGGYDFCMLGGLGQKYADLLNADLRKRICRPHGDALSGAIALAMQNFSR